MKYWIPFICSFIFTLQFASAQCPSNIVELDSQAAVDDFVATYPSCDELSRLYIGGDLPSDITDLSGLSMLTSVSYNLVIKNNSLLSNLSGLENLSTLYRLDIDNNPSLISLTGLENLTSLEKLKIENNTSLNTLLALQNIPPPYINSIEIIENPSLITLEGLAVASTVYDLYIANNANLINLNGLNNITNVNAGIGLVIRDNPALQSLEGLQNLTTCVDNVIIYNNDALTSLEGLNNLAYILTDLSIVGNDQLENIAALESLQTFGAMHFEDNSQLSQCSIEVVCAYLMEEGAAIIENNMVGCNTKEEILEYCSAVYAPTLDAPSVIVYPNPAHQQLFIEGLATEEVQQIQIFNQVGQVVFYSRQAVSSIFIEHFYSGIYLLQIDTQQGIVYRKITINP